MRNDITIEEAQKIANRYKELEKIKDKEEFVKATFEEVKKNFGYGDKPIKLEITRNGDGIGGCIIDNSSIKIDIHENLRFVLIDQIHEVAKMLEIIQQKCDEFREAQFSDIQVEELKKKYQSFVLQLSGEKATQ